MKDLSKAGLEANLEHWQCLAARYMRQRDAAMKEVRMLQALLLEKTGRAYDGQDYLRVIKETETRPTWRHWLKNITEAFRELR